MKEAGQQNRSLMTGILALMLLTSSAQAQPYVPSQLDVWGHPLIIPVAWWDKTTGSILDPVTVAIASRPTFGRVRYTQDGYLAYFPSRRYIVPDSFIYSIQDSEGYSVKVKVMIDPHRQPVQIHHRGYRYW